MEKLYTSEAFFKKDGRRMHSLPFILPRGPAPGHKLQKPSKESSIFQSLGIISFFFFLLKCRVKKGGAWHKAPPPKYAPAL